MHIFIDAFQLTVSCAEISHGMVEHDKALLMDTFESLLVFL